MNCVEKFEILLKSFNHDIYRTSTIKTYVEQLFSDNLSEFKVLFKQWLYGKPMQCGFTENELIFAKETFKLVYERNYLEFSCFLEILEMSNNHHLKEFLLCLALSVPEFKNSIYVNGLITNLLEDDNDPTIKLIAIRLLSTLDYSQVNLSDSYIPLLSIFNFYKNNRSLFKNELFELVKVLVNSFRLHLNDKEPLFMVRDKLTVNEMIFKELVQLSIHNPSNQDLIDFIIQYICFNIKPIDIQQYRNSLKHLIYKIMELDLQENLLNISLLQNKLLSAEEYNQGFINYFQQIFPISTNTNINQIQKFLKLLLNLNLFQLIENHLNDIVEELKNIYQDKIEFKQSFIDEMLADHKSIGDGDILKLLFKTLPYNSSQNTKLIQPTYDMVLLQNYSNINNNNNNNNNNGNNLMSNVLNDIKHPGEYQNSYNSNRFNNNNNERDNNNNIEERDYEYFKILPDYLIKKIILLQFINKIGLWKRLFILATVSWRFFKLVSKVTEMNRIKIPFGVGSNYDGSVKSVFHFDSKYSLISTIPYHLSNGQFQSIPYKQIQFMIYNNLKSLSLIPTPWGITSTVCGFTSPLQSLVKLSISEAPYQRLEYNINNRNISIMVDFLDLTPNLEEFKFKISSLSNIGYCELLPRYFTNLLEKCKNLHLFKLKSSTVFELTSFPLESLIPSLKIQEERSLKVIATDTMSTKFMSQYSLVSIPNGYSNYLKKLKINPNIRFNTISRSEVTPNAFQRLETLDIELHYEELVQQNPSFFSSPKKTNQYYLHFLQLPSITKLKMSLNIFGLEKCTANIREILQISKSCSVVVLNIVEYSNSPSQTRDFSALKDIIVDVDYTPYQSRLEIHYYTKSIEYLPSTIDFYYPIRNLKFIPSYSTVPNHLIFQKL
ncbi:hypothetical protein DLAC_09519 [Tieghemostelium lacteum]|uniref:Uncharacterized protein n=1 Tax=Tieghemostelium lacteum TaxID=361077 RepID=A0A151Z6K7_TIELA|nr:hypothetical protein DLAC_09519 [Tieghemostelium lacteum]|eukprot:KYQ89567.1 hypothetical protein DLAC_09519 [Tieghemostelium lacteum]